MQNIQIKIVYVPVSSLKVADYNPRKASPEAMSHIKKSISRFQMIDPIIVNSTPNRKNVVIGGHMRLRAAKELNMSTIPVVYVDIPDLEKEKELNLRLNANTGEWDLDKLKTFGSDFLSEIGFSDIDLSNIFDTNLETKEDNWSDEVELKKIKKTNIKTGDIYQLGQHRLICGSSLDSKVVEKLMNGAKATLTDNDIPFNILLPYSKYGGSYIDDKTDQEYKTFVKTIMQNALSVTEKDAHVVFWCDERYVWLLEVLYKELGINSKRLLIWCKNNSSPTNTIAFNKVTEFAVYGTRGKAYLAKNVTNLNQIQNHEMTTGNSLHDEIMDFFNIMLTKRLPSNKYEHSAQKDPSIHYKVLKRCTKVGDICLDLTAGTGSFLIACEQLKRVAYVCEIDPKFCQLIVNHYELLSGKKAQLIKN